jgi:protein-S-isoprenylcysteine O-methyltransferase Ste14
MAGEGMIRRVVVRTLIWLAITGALLFIPAGTLAWPEAWVLLAEFGGLGLASGIAIGRSDPALLRERMASPIQRTQKGWDKLLLMALFFFWMSQYVVAGLDAVRFHASHVPLWLQVVGALAIALGFYVAHAVMLENTFAAPVVKIQTERKHQVISTGPYALVRHPMYVGVIPITIGTALLLGSWVALLWSLAVIAVLIIRAVLEEDTLKSELEGYAAYAAHVRYRLIPGVW